MVQLSRPRSTIANVSFNAAASSEAVQTVSRSSSPGQLNPESGNGEVAAPGAPARTQSAKTRWQARCADRRPDGPALGDRHESQLFLSEPGYDIAQRRVVARPVAEGGRIEVLTVRVDVVDEVDEAGHVVSWSSKIAR